MEYSKNEEEITRLRAEVEALKKQNGELSAAIVKLNGQLRRSQQYVNSLQEKRKLR